MKKIIYLFVIFFVKHSAFSQESIKVSYKNYYDLGVPILRNSELYIHDNKTVYIEGRFNKQMRQPQKTLA